MIWWQLAFRIGGSAALCFWLIRGETGWFTASAIFLLFARWDVELWGDWMKKRALTKDLTDKGMKEAVWRAYRNLRKEGPLG